MQNAIISKVKELFSTKYGKPQLLVRSPGRVNIIGEHTDYNDGFVLPAAIDKAVYMALSPRTDDKICLTAMDLDESREYSLQDIAPETVDGWAAYVVGSAAQFAKKDVKLTGFNLVFSSDVPMGSGLSSSAAVECATVFAINELWQTGLDRVEMVKMAQKAEHEYAGVMCGIMDQFASMMGKKDHVIKLDCRSLEYEYVPFKLEGIKILLLNTNVKHSLASSEYNTRRMECETAVGWVKEHAQQVNALRDISEAQLDQFVLPKDALIDMRARYVVQEIDRLLTGCDDLRDGDIKALGKKMLATHDGLSKMYAVSCKELDWLVNRVRYNGSVLGARMMGGGFGGCTINLVSEEAIEAVVAAIKPDYEAQMELPLTYYVASIENGTELMPL
jgi:galactokinase